MFTAQRSAPSKGAVALAWLLINKRESVIRAESQAATELANSETLARPSMFMKESRKFTAAGR